MFMLTDTAGSHTTMRPFVNESKSIVEHRNNHAVMTEVNHERAR